MCCASECESSKIKKNTTEYKVKVLGISEQEILASNKRRNIKAAETRKRLGSFNGPNNPNSKARLLQKLSLEEINQKHKDVGRRSVQTKRASGYFIKENNPFSQEYWIKHGLTEEQADEKIRQKNKNCEDYWLSRNYSNEEAKLLAKENASTNSLNYKIKKYGDSGYANYEQTKTKMSLSWNPASAGHYNFGTSKSARNFFRIIYKMFRRELKIEKKSCVFKHSGNPKEFFIRSDNDIFFYDFCLPKEKLIIEFNGEHVHVSPELTELELAAWKHAFNKKPANEIIAYDTKKLELAKSKGFTAIVVWYNSQESGIFEIKSFIENYGNQN